MTCAANVMLEEISQLHQKLEDLAKTDGLTQLYNRRLFQGVDSLLYQAKERGRNQIVLSDTLNQARQ
nr:hypothetical protein [uncultured Desulfobulbus sp.]